MLRKEAVVPEMTNLIKELQSDSLFKDHVLAGGTALALHFGHRTSTDIDLFTAKKQKKSEIVQLYKNKYLDTSIDTVSDEFIRIFVNNTKIEMVYYDEKTLEK